MQIIAPDEAEQRAALSPFLEAPRRAGILMDFDGTLAPIVDAPEDALPLEGVPALLGRLAELYGRVGVVSGRPIHFLQSVLPAGVAMAGQYGLERLVAGEMVEQEQAGAWREVIADLATTLTAHVPDGLRVENKGFSLTIHFREHPELESAARTAATEQVRRSGLEMRDARCSVELHPPIDVDKGTAVLALAKGLKAVCFIGDDAGDLPAFDVLDDLAVQGIATLRLAVASTEAPRELLERADLTLPDPAAVAALLEILLDVT